MIRATVFKILQKPTLCKKAKTPLSYRTQRGLDHYIELRYRRLTGILMRPSYFILVLSQKTSGTTPYCGLLLTNNMIIEKESKAGIFTLMIYFGAF
jgi:hypothetical protein